MTSSADLPEGFLAEVFRNGCQCDHCVKWRAEVARLREEREQFNTLFAKAMEHNARLQQENADLIYTNREQAGMIEGAGVTIVKLREAIKRAANRHQDIDAGVVCCCELCEIAREKR